METKPQTEEHKHLHRLPITLPWAISVIYFVTCCTHERRQLFVTKEIVKLALDELINSRQRLHWGVGGVVFMPDHVHLFCSPPEREGQLISKFIGAWRSATSRRVKDHGMEEPFWQKSFFDHLLRSGESYSAKWAYVRDNPGRAGRKDFQRWFVIDQLELR
jgi:REP element-mobilizing transposase RayT